MNARMAVVVLTSSLMACGGRTHEQEEGCYALTPVSPSGIIRDECQLLADAAAILGARLVIDGNVVEMGLRFSTPSQGELLTVSMAGRFDYSREVFTADGTASNIPLPIGGQTCQIQWLDVHLDATTDSATRFAGLIRLGTRAPLPESCICQTWFEYQADLGTTATCP
jgi:hypothetical protein